MRPELSAGKFALIAQPLGPAVMHVPSCQVDVILADEGFQ